jgi:catechol 2,3-dioxygenase-like lactoylglutathione lyase family enzyme
MATTYRYDHMHLRSRDVKKTAEYYHRIFGAEIVDRSSRTGGPGPIST